MSRSRHRRDGDRSLCRQQDLSSPPCPDVDKDAQSRAARSSNPGMNRKELARGDYPAAYHRDIILSRRASGGPLLFPLLRLSWHRSRLEKPQEPVPREKDGTRATQGGTRKRGGLLRGSSYTGHPRYRRWTAMGCCTNLLPSSSMPEGGVSPSQKCQG